MSEESCSHTNVQVVRGEHARWGECVACKKAVWVERDKTIADVLIEIDGLKKQLVELTRLVKIIYQKGKR